MNLGSNKKGERQSAKGQKKALENKEKEEKGKQPYSIH